MTGNGLKDPDTAMDVEMDLKYISPNIDDLMNVHFHKAVILC